MLWYDLKVIYLPRVVESSLCITLHFCAKTGQNKIIKLSDISSVSASSLALTFGYLIFLANRSADIKLNVKAITQLLLTHHFPWTRLMKRF